MALWTPGMRITAARLNAIVSGWQDYTPTWRVASGTATLGNGSLDGRYQLVGKTCEFAMRFEFGSSTTTSVATADWEFDLPVFPTAVKGTTFQPVSAWIYDPGPPARWSATAYVNSSTGRCTFIVTHADGAPISRGEMPSQTTAGGTSSIQPGEVNFVSGCRLNIWGRYETV